MDWGVVWSVVFGMTIFALMIATIVALLAWLMIRKVKKGTRAGASQKFSFPCAAFFGEKTEPATK